MDDKDTYSIGQVADLFGISVRQLHHWDGLGLAPASRRSPSGYRLYCVADIERLQQALVYRETGMPLAAIKDALDSQHDEHEHLVKQLELLIEQQNKLTQRINAVEKLLEKTMGNKSVSIEEKAKILGSDWNPAWEDEARSRWSHTDDWQISAERQANMTGSDWKEFKAANDSIEKKMVEALNDGVLPDSERAMQLAEEHRKVLSYMYPVTHSKHVLLARMYNTDPRFASHYNAKHCELTEWLGKAINANALAHGVNPQTATWE